MAQLVNAILEANLQKVQARIAAACARAGRSPADVRLVAVTKYVGVEIIRALHSLGAIEMGENRVQQLAARAEALAQGDPADGASGSRGGGPAIGPIRWHMIGHLQRNKVRLALRWSRFIHSVDSTRLADEISKQAAALEIPAVDVLIEVNVSGEASKEGVAAAEVEALARHVCGLPHVQLRGLMTMAPHANNPEDARPCFRKLRECRDRLLADGALPADGRQLSMGMSGDFEVAVEEGATLVRIGSTLYEGIDLNESG